MSGSLNKVALIGNLGSDPEAKSFSNGGEVCNLSIATTESWKDKNSGERKTKTEWHRVAIFNEGLVRISKDYLKKGSKVYLEGALETRSWEQDGQKKYSTEVVLKGFSAKLIMLDGKSQEYDQSTGEVSQPSAGSAPVDELEDEIPF